MRNRRLLLLTVVLLGVLGLFWGRPARAQTNDAPSVRRHVDSVIVRTPAPGALNVYRDDPAFRYDRAQTGTSWWDRLKRWLWETLFAPAMGPLGVWYRPLLYILLTAALVFAFVQFARMRAGGGFEAPARPMSANFREIEENLRAANLDALTETAVREGDHRRAVRLLYLHALRALADAGCIDWDPAKTNRTYVREVAGASPQASPQSGAQSGPPEGLAGELDELTRLFERIWYGHADVTASTFDRLRPRFDRFRRQVEQEGVAKKIGEDQAVPA
jgi:hypothetical protein